MVTSEMLIPAEVAPAQFEVEQAGEARTTIRSALPPQVDDEV